ncbi:MAG: penicillin-insensitive murein endopeptidase [Aestuariivirga sp.]|uniref:penicillin-insensitive murein endopeptidase n=1 Tax=Aestuariivirga sp. TaxID=2650926 RepID=UPI0025BE570F|nr:penicillin-insensitive murein endopeptidase [Aestuariivirga sp.]MCA3560388.1 penicillin-insensitive murein endopeptidase [Aestuariivirga sp.]
MKRPLLIATALLAAGLGIIGAAWSQSVVDMRALAALSDAELMKLPAKKLFSSFTTPAASMKSRPIGFYAKGCQAGAVALPIDGPAWQVIRLSRNRNWGQPVLVDVIERLATEAKAKDGWNGLLVADMSMPRGGPMPSGHASHQIGLDADIWFKPMPDRRMTAKERENIKPEVVAPTRHGLDKSLWTEAHARLLKRTASYPEVERIFVNPPIKAELCKWATGDRSWLAKVRPYFNHNYHFHIRLRCPAGANNCKPQPSVRPADGTGCGKELAYWMGNGPWKSEKKPPEKKPPKPVKPPPPLTLASLPAECRAVVTAE